MFRIASVVGAAALIGIGLLASPMPAAAQADQEQYAFDRPERLIIAGFNAGQLAPFREMLLEKGLINEQDQWTGGSAHFVQAGDMLLFGDEVLESLRLLHSLAEQAQEDGGRVTLIMGPSLFMALRDDISNIPASNYRGMATDESEAKFEAHLSALLEELWEYNEQYEEQLRQRLGKDYDDYYRRTHEVGAVEFLEAIGAETELGAWLRTAPAVIRVGGVLISNGGVSEQYAAMSLEKINETIRQRALRDYVWVPKMVDGDSPVWWKELSTQPAESLQKSVESTLSKFGARAMAVAHSPSLGESMKRGRVYHIQSGLTPDERQTALIATLEVIEDRWFFTVGERKFLTQPPEPLVPEPAPAPDDAG